MSFYREKPDKKKPVAKVPRAPGVPRQTTSNVTLSLDNTSTAENIYLDCVFRNESAYDYNDVIFRASRNIPILQAREDYKLGVISVNGLLNIPLLTNFIGMRMSIDWVDNLGAPGPRVTALPLNIGRLDVFTVAQVLDKINGQFSALWALFLAAWTVRYPGQVYPRWGPLVGNVLVQASAQPVLTFDNDTQTFSLIADRTYGFPAPVVPNLSSYPKLFIDQVGIDLIYGVRTGPSIVSPAIPPAPPLPAAPETRSRQIIFESGLYNQYVRQFVDLGPPLAVYYTLENSQNIPTIGTWHKTNSLIITSNNLGGRNVQISRGSNDPQSSSSEVLNVIDSFPLNLHGGFNRTIIFSNPNINYVDIMSTGPLNEVEFSLQMMNRDGILETLQIPPRSTIVVKLVFSKTLFTAI